MRKQYTVTLKTWCVILNALKNVKDLSDPSSPPQDDKSSIRCCMIAGDADSGAPVSAFHSPHPASLTLRHLPLKGKAFGFACPAASPRGEAVGKAD